MGKIATENEAYEIGGSGTPVTNKCCTKSKAEEFGCLVEGDYSNNQLVQLSDLKAGQNYKSMIIQLNNILDQPTYDSASGFLQFELSNGEIIECDISGKMPVSVEFEVPYDSNGIVTFDDYYITMSPQVAGKAVCLVDEIVQSVYDTGDFQGLRHTFEVSSLP